MAAAAVSGGLLVGLAQTPASAAVSCDVQYALNSWGSGSGGFTASLDIKNLGDPVSNWTLRFDFPNGQRLSNGWSANWSQSGSTVTATSMSWNGNLGTGATTNIGFQGTWSGSNNKPASFSINGVTCGATVSPSPSPSPSPTRSPSPSPSPTRSPSPSPSPTLSPSPSPSPSTSPTPGTDNEYIKNFMTMYNKIHDPANGYFSPEGVPYHSVETLLVEAPDQGHETTSEAFSYYLWLEAMYGKITGDWTKFNTAWTTMEKYIIPSHADQPTNDKYDASKPATYAGEWNDISQYPSRLDSGVSVGTDPIANELKSAYGTSDIYGMHWLLDVDNTYGFGRCGDGTTKPAYINTYQRGPEESVFETIPQPSCDTFKFGGPNGFLDLFTGDASYAKQWKYTNAPDADARAVQAAYWALTWATEQGKQSQISTAVSNAAKMGDYLRYAMYDKYFKQPNCTSTSCPAGTGKNASNYLLSWYYAWGGAYDTSAGWAWRIGSSHNHGGYQNPMAAWALSNVNALKPKGSTAVSDWSTSLTRQLQFYKWLQSAEGGIAGGATNSWEGHYASPPSSLPKFFGMAYDWQPVYHDPPSNQWFGFQAWSMERVAELYYATGNADAKTILDKWVAWALSGTTVNSDGTFQIPSTLRWTGQPDASFSGSGMPSANTGLHVTIQDYTDDIGVAGSYAKTLMFYAAKSGNAQAKSTAKALLDGIWKNNQDAKGVSVAETKADYNRLDDPIYVPSGWSGKMPNGDPINSNSTFISIRSWYKNDPDWSKVQSYLNGGSAPVFHYHRFWAQTDVATALGQYGLLFPNG
ncbi:glycoside hydrolase family 48 protein [Microbispora hainanensis]|uniref:glycoside hydrolase family 48 protein n=1 Tax=Microbispora hainanensis TaxID=568844 RepID=UPI001FCC931F|nr:glycoside hydrolase family 48 protein [Microbispora hainanensis]